ncbi:sugar phosphate isomerase/epimerase family protein [Microscilla marina]|uniref:AP endonuclease, family 2, putative n=1 Tax=Microscilla marina ATCC 23134 TaxID=313606 RepID=A1ZRD9_MICM2|nr:sugar phosphate isomerase/epimerase [Microscilla marina]EAY27029.1 AP endonuclease, family 2, putative [Microscilla marina ATCC 23134]
MNTPPILVSILDLNQRVADEMAQKGLGIELSGFAFPEVLAEGALEKNIKETQDILKGFPYPVTMHGAFWDLRIAVREPMIRQVAEFRMRQSLEIAHELGINKVVFHPNYTSRRNDDDMKRYWVGQQIDFWRALQPDAQKHGITIYLENTGEPTADYIHQILNQLDPQVFATCLDTGHLNVFGDNKNVLDWVNTYSHQLGYVHLHANFGKRDEHIAYTEGNMDFTGFFEALTNIEQGSGTRPWIIIEVKSREAYLKSYEALRRQYGQ